LKTMHLTTIGVMVYLELIYNQTAEAEVLHKHNG
jgi:hypothetical protein